MKTTILGRLPAVVVEYDSRGQRVRKEFADAFAARRFYTQKAREGKNPQVKGSSREGSP